MKHYLFPALLLLLAGSAADAQQPGAPLQRLVAQSYYSLPSAGGSVLLLDDTVHYTYSGLRGSRFDYNNLRYTDLTEIGSAPLADFINLRLPTNNIDSSYYPPVDFDSAFYHVHISTTGGPDPLTGCEGHTYTAAGGYNRVNNQVYSGSPPALTYAQRSVNVYASGRLARSYIMSYNAGVYDTSFIRDFAYDAAGRLLLDSLTARNGFAVPTAFFRLSYTYSGTGTGFATATQAQYRPGPPRLVTVSRSTDTYYPDGRLKTAAYESSFSSGGALEATVTDSFGYTPGVAGYTYMAQLDADKGSNGYNYFTRAVHFNAAGQKDSVTLNAYQGTMLLGESSTAILYDGGGYPVKRRDYDAGPNPRLVSEEHYYYEHYGAAPGGVPALPPVSVFVSPNPTGGLIQLRFAGPASGRPLVVRITNAVGQLVHLEAFAAQGAEAMILLGDEAAPGLYALSVSAASGQVIFSGMIVKQ